MRHRLAALWIAVAVSVAAVEASSGKLSLSAFAASLQSADGFSVCPSVSQADKCPARMKELNSDVKCNCYNFCNGQFIGCCDSNTMSLNGGSSERSICHVSCSQTGGQEGPVYGCTDDDRESEVIVAAAEEDVSDELPFWDVKTDDGRGTSSFNMAWMEGSSQNSGVSLSSNENGCVVSRNQNECPEAMATLGEDVSCDCYNFCDGEFLGCCNKIANKTHSENSCSFSCEGRLTFGCTDDDRPGSAMDLSDEPISTSVETTTGPPTLHPSVEPTLASPSPNSEAVAVDSPTDSPISSSTPAPVDPAPVAMVETPVAPQATPSPTDAPLAVSSSPPTTGPAETSSPSVLSTLDPSAAPTEEESDSDEAIAAWGTVSNEVPIEGPSESPTSAPSLGSTDPTASSTDETGVGLLEDASSPTDTLDTVEPTGAPTSAPTNSPTASPSSAQTGSPVMAMSPSASPTDASTSAPTGSPTPADDEPTETGTPTGAPTAAATGSPTLGSSSSPTGAPSQSPVVETTERPTSVPTSASASVSPTASPTESPTDSIEEEFIVDGSEVGSALGTDVGAVGVATIDPIVASHIAGEVGVVETPTTSEGELPPWFQGVVHPTGDIDDEKPVEESENDEQVVGVGELSELAPWLAGHTGGSIDLQDEQSIEEAGEDSELDELAPWLAGHHNATILHTDAPSSKDGGEKGPRPSSKDESDSRDDRPKSKDADDFDLADVAAEFASVSGEWTDSATTAATEKTPKDGVQKGLFKKGKESRGKRSGPKGSSSEASSNADLPDIGRKDARRKKARKEKRRGLRQSTRSVQESSSSAHPRYRVRESLATSLVVAALLLSW